MLNTLRLSHRFGAGRIFNNGKSLTNPSPVEDCRRHFFGLLNHIFNKPDGERIKEVGADRACAEWLLRCGARLKWRDSNSWETDYNHLPPATGRSLLHIEQIDADDAAVMAIGFLHLDGLKHLKKARFHHCAHFDDSCVQQLSFVQQCLEHLEISSCDVSDEGLASLSSLRLLKFLLIYDLPEVKDKKACFDILQNALPTCKIQYKDMDSNKNT